MPERSVTPRGFAVYDRFADSYGHEVAVQKSSNASFDAVWIFTYRNEGDKEGFEPSPHLDVGQATRLRDALDEFISEHGEAVASA